MYISKEVLILMIPVKKSNVVKTVLKNGTLKLSKEENNQQIKSKKRKMVKQ